jgi:hypothetical protein
MILCRVRAVFETHHERASTIDGVFRRLHTPYLGSLTSLDPAEEADFFQVGVQ